MNRVQFQPGLSMAEFMRRFGTQSSAKQRSRLPAGLRDLPALSAEVRRARRFAARGGLAFGDGLIAEELVDRWEDWMRDVDRSSDERELLQPGYQALAPGSWSAGMLGDLPSSPPIPCRAPCKNSLRTWPGSSGSTPRRPKSWQRQPSA
jgi:hypothetical protein